MPAILERPKAIATAGKQRKTGSQMAAEIRAECNNLSDEEHWRYYQMGLEMVRKAGNGHAIVAFRR